VHRLLYTSTAEKLLTIIDRLEARLVLQSDKIARLESELKRLKKLTPKASRLPKSKSSDSSSSSSGKRAGSAKKHKTANLPIDETVVIDCDNLPDGVRHKGYQDSVIQDLVIKRVVTRYRLARWLLPSGGTITASLPKAVKGHHFGPTLRAYILHQYPINW